MSIPAVTYAYFSSIFPELASIPSATVDALNPVGLIYVSEAVYGDQSQYALALAIAHNYVLGQQKGAGPVTSDRIGQLATANAALSTEDSMRSTSYGMRLWELGRMLGGAGAWAGGGNKGIPPFGGFQPTWTGPGESGPFG